MAALLLGLSFEAKSAGPSGFSVMIEFQTAQTNRTKTGISGLYHATNFLTGELYVFRKSEETHDVNITGSDCSDMKTGAKGQDVTRTRTWSVDYDPSELLSGEESEDPLFTCGWLPPSTDCLDGYVFYRYGTTGQATACTNNVECNEWDSQDPCPNSSNWFNNQTFVNLSTNVNVDGNAGYESVITIGDYAMATGVHCIAVSGTETTIIQLSDAYSTGELVDEMKEDVDAMLGNTVAWSKSGMGSLDLTVDEICGTYQKGKFRIKYIGPKGYETDVTIRLDHSVHYLSHTTNWSDLIVIPVLCTGQVQESKLYDLEPFYEAGVKESTVIATREGCSSCGSSSGFAHENFELSEGMFAGFGLGDCNDMDSAGFIYFQGDGPDPDLSDPSTLSVFANAAGAEVIGEDPIRQVASADGLVEVEDGENPNQYTISFYSDPGTKNQTTGLYEPEEESLVETFTVALLSENPAFRLRISKLSGGYTEYINTNGWWFIDRGDGKWTQGDFLVRDSNGNILTNTFRVFSSAGATEYSESTSYSMLGGSIGRVLQNSIIGTGSDTTTNSWFYKTDVATNHVNYGKRTMIVDAVGYWERYEYDATTGLRTKKVVPLGSVATNASDSVCRVFEYSYTPFHPDDDGLLQADRPRVVYESLQGNPVGMKGIALWPSMRLEVEYWFPFGDFPDPQDYDISEWGHRLTWTKELTYANGKGTRIIAPDGTVTFNLILTNATGAFSTNLVYTGHAEGEDPAEIESGTLDLTLTSTADNKVHLAESYDYQNSDPNLLISQQSYSYFGAGSNSFTITHLDGTTETRNYSTCCGLGSWADRDGVTTEYFYDARRRQIASLRLGILSSNLFDNAGNVLETWRIPSQGQSIRLASYAYDTAGRLRYTTDALGLVTTNTYSFAGDGRSIESAYFPDGSYQLQYLNRDGTIERLVGTAVFPTRYVYDFDENTYGWEITQEIKLDNSLNDTLETTITGRDWFNRPNLMVNGNGAEKLAEYPTEHQVIQTDPDGVVAISESDLFEHSFGTDLNQDGTLTSTIDRRTRSVTDYHTKSGTWNVRRSITYQWNDAGSEIGVSTNETSVDGLRSWQSSFGGTYQSQTVYGANSTRTQTQTAADGSYTLLSFKSGRLVASERFTSGAVKIAHITFGYDAHSRQNTVTNEVTDMVTTLLYNDLDQVISNIVSAPGQSDQITRNTYNSAGKITSTVLPDGTALTNEYFATGLLKKTFGGRTYPVEYTYDAQGRMKTMKTWRDFSFNGGTAVTTWSYNAYTGFLTNKLYADGKSVGYTYTPGGRLKSRTWARGNPKIVTNYTYGSDDGQSSNEHGDLVGIAYSNDTVETPDVSFTYDRRGRQTSVSQGGITTSRSYNDAGELLVESYSGGPLSGLGVTNIYDSLLRRQTLAVSAEPDPVTQGFSYDLASRLATLTQATYSATYSYVANSSLIGQIDFRENSTVRMNTTRQYDALNRLTNMVSTPTGAGQSPISFGYVYNQASQRTLATRQNGAYWVYQYDKLGQVISGKKYWSDGTSVAGQQFKYDFDDIGNRKNAATGGNQWGTGQRYEKYSINDVNQYTSRIIPGAVDVIGEADDEATVTVNNHSTYRKGDYFRAEVPVGNSSGPVWLSITNLAVIRDDPDQTNLLGGNLFVPQSPESLAYDDDGNLVSDGRWSYEWDAENRWVSAETISGAVGAGVPKEKLVIAYDWQGRRISKTVSNWTGSAWAFNYQRKFLYDEWNVIAELDADNNLVRSYAWGTDLSGTVQGAGGVGGLLFVTDEDNGGTHAVVHDGIGNVMMLVDGSDGSVSGEYEYEPFGKVIKVIGPNAQSNPIRFSTKYQDVETGFNYYGYRYYDPDKGRWASRDPVAEKGGRNIYGFVLNDPVNVLDWFGLGDWKVIPKELDLNDPKYNVLATDPSGFEVQYHPNKGEGENGSIILYQIISSTGALGKPAHVDTSSTPSTMGACKLPPAIKPKGSTPYSYDDSPGDRNVSGFFGIQIHKVTAVAVCRSKCKDTILSTYYFEFDNKTRKLNLKVDGTNPGHYKTGMKEWKTDGGAE